ncbi:MAG TPA: hypothetical protein PLT23_02120 [Lentisphaeria bacterium]|nr:hypothetical protein [Lentisphaeria bacterium]
MAQGLDKAERRRKPGRSGRWLPSSWLAFALVALTLPGYVSAAGSRAGKRIQPGGLGPLPTYPPETAGWDTSQILMVYPCSGLSSDSAQAGVYAAGAERLEAGLRQRGYAVLPSPAGVAAMVTAPMRGRVTRAIVPQANSGRTVKLADGRIGREVVFMVRVAKPEQIGNPRAGRIFLAAAQGVYPTQNAITAWTEQQLLFDAVDTLFCIPAFRQALQ